MVIKHNFFFVAEARNKLEGVGYDGTLKLTAFPVTDNIVMLSVGDFLDFPELERFMFVIISRRFSFKNDGMDITYLIDLAADDSNAPNLKLIK